MTNHSATPEHGCKLYIAGLKSSDYMLGAVHLGIWYVVLAFDDQLLPLMYHFNMSSMIHHAIHIMKLVLTENDITNERVYYIQVNYVSITLKLDSPLDVTNLRML